MRCTYGLRDTILYNLGVGANAIPSATDADLTLTWEERLIALPTMAAVLGWEPAWYYEPEVGLDWRNTVHGEQSIEWHAPIAPAGEIIAQSSVDELYDKGAGRGALLVIRRELRDALTGAPLATIRQSIFFRKDGGFGGPNDAPRPRQVPASQPDIRHTLVSRPEQALIYRLSGDLFALHIDPAFAQAAGFDGPVLHGLCTYGFAGRALIAELCGGAGDRLRRMDVRFSAPVTPGDTIETLIWRLGPGEAAFRCQVGERIVIDNGYARFD
ncbi:MAG: MaoC/PaaZ C-terminal domain-containing protein [Sphingobium sp.]